VRDSSDMGDNASNIVSDDDKLSMATEAEDICQGEYRRVKLTIESLGREE